MRIGISGRTSDVGRIEEQARDAEAVGFRSLWYAGGGGGDAVAAAAFAGRATTTMEVGTAVVATYPTHPVQLAARAAFASEASGGRFTLGIGPSHQLAMEQMYGLQQTRPGRHTAEYLVVVAAQLAGQAVDLDGEVIQVHVPPAAPATHPVPVLIAALGPRLLELAGTAAAGTILWMANATAIESHVTPVITAAAAAAGRPAPRIVAGLPVAVHDDPDEARATAAQQFAMYGRLPNYQRILGRGGIARPEEAVIVGDEAVVTRQVRGLFAAGATDVWAEPFTVGADRRASRARTMALLGELATEADA